MKEAYLVLPKERLDGPKNATAATHAMLYSVCKGMGFKIITANRFLRYPELFVKLLAVKGCVIVVPHPSVFSPVILSKKAPRFRKLIKEAELLFWGFILKRNHGIVYVYDDAVDQNLYLGANIIVEGSSRDLEKRFLELFDALVVFGEEHKRILQKEYGLASKNFEYYDFSEIVSGTNLKKEGVPSKEYRIGYVSGNLDTCDFLLELDKGISKRMQLYGPTKLLKGEFERRGMKCWGPLRMDDLLTSLNQNCEFGLVAYPEGIEAYVKRGATSKLSSYILAGIPVLYPRAYKHIADLNKNYKIGVEFDGFDDLPRLLGLVTEKDYERLSNNCSEVGRMISGAKFTKGAFKKALGENKNC